MAVAFTSTKMAHCSLVLSKAQFLMGLAQWWTNKIE